MTEFIREHLRPIELLEFLERGLLLAMGSIALGAWTLMVLRLFSDFNPLFELATHASLHAFLGCLAVLLFEILFFLIRRHSINAARWKRRLSFTLVPLIFFGWVTTPWRLLPLKPAASNPRSLKILSWNMLLVNRHFEDVIELIRREKPDIVSLIEVSPLAAKALDSLRVEYPYGMWLPAWEGCGIAMFSRIPDSSFRTIYPANTWMPAIELELERDEEIGGRLSILTVHTVSPDAGNGSRTLFRDAQLKVLGDWASDKKNAAMIVGDLNITPWSPPFWRLLEEGRLIDSDWYRGYFPSWPTILGSMGIPIDHALVNDKIKVLDRKNVYDRVHSDHYPILISIQ